MRSKKSSLKPSPQPTPKGRGTQFEIDNRQVKTGSVATCGSAWFNAPHRSLGKKVNHPLPQVVLTGHTYGNIIKRHSLWFKRHVETAGVHGCRPGHTGAGHRRQHGDLYLDRCRALETLAG